MKLLIAVVLSCLGAAASAQSLPAGGDAKIVIYRPSSMIGAGVACPVRYKGVEIVELGRGKYAELVIPAGTYTLENKIDHVDVQVASGETKYVRCTVKIGIVAGKANLKIVEASDFQAHAGDYQRKDIVQPAPAQ